MDTTTYSEFASIPSAEDNPFKSIKTEVSTAVEAGNTALEAGLTGRWAEMDADFYLSDGHSIATFGIGVYGYVDGPNADQEGLAADVATARRDLEFFKAQFEAWYTEADAALNEFSAEAGVSA